MKILKNKKKLLMDLKLEYFNMNMIKLWDKLLWTGELTKEIFIY